MRARGSDAVATRGHRRRARALPARTRLAFSADETMARVVDGFRLGRRGTRSAWARSLRSSLSWDGTRRSGRRRPPFSRDGSSTTGSGPPARSRSAAASSRSSRGIAALIRPCVRLARSGTPSVRDRHGGNDRDPLLVCSPQGRLPLDRLLEPRRGAEPDLPLPAALRRAGSGAGATRRRVVGGRPGDGRVSSTSSMRPQLASTVSLLRGPRPRDPRSANRKLHWTARDRARCSSSSPSLGARGTRRHRLARQTAETRSAHRGDGRRRPRHRLGTRRRRSMPRSGEHDFSARMAGNMAQPWDWLDRATGGRTVVTLGQQITDPTGIWLIEFWNRSVQKIWSTDGSAPGPGPTLTPDLATARRHAVAFAGDRLRVGLQRDGAAGAGREAGGQHDPLPHRRQAAEARLLAERSLLRRLDGQTELLQPLHRRAGWAGLRADRPFALGILHDGADPRRRARQARAGRDRLRQAAEDRPRDGAEARPRAAVRRRGPDGLAAGAPRPVARRGDRGHVRAERGRSP